MVHDTMQDMQRMSYSRPRQASSSSASGCRHLRFKAFFVITLGVLLVVTYPVGHTAALLIVGLCIIILGVALAFLDYVARGMGKDNGSSRGVNHTWHRLHRQRRDRRRRVRCSALNPPSSGHGSCREGSQTEDGMDRPPSYETSLSVEELIGQDRCPEPSDWTFLPSEPPPLYFPPTTDINSNSAAERDRSTDQPQPPIFSISLAIGEATFSLPSYEEAISPRPTNDDVRGSEACLETSITVTPDHNQDISVSGDVQVSDPSQSSVLHYPDINVPTSNDDCTAQVDESPAETLDRSTEEEPNAHEDQVVRISVPGL